MQKQTQYSRTFEIRSTETDLWDRLHLEDLFSMLQEVASEHATLLGTGTDVLDKRNLVYLLSGMSLRIKEYPVWGDRLKIRTWCREIARLFFVRDYRVETISGKEIAAGTSSWFLTDKDTHRPVRPSQIEDLIEDYVYPKDNALGFNAPRFKTGDLEFPDGTSFTKFADFSDMDRNRHVNNTKYIAWAVDRYYHHFGIDEPASICGVDVNFLSEVKYGDKLNILGRALNLDTEDETKRLHDRFAIEGQDEEQRALFRCILYH